MVLGAGGLGKVSLGSIDCCYALGNGRLGQDVSTRVGEYIPSSGADLAFYL